MQPIRSTCSDPQLTSEEVHQCQCACWFMCLFCTVPSIAIIQFLRQYVPCIGKINILTVPTILSSDYMANVLAGVIAAVCTKIYLCVAQGYYTGQKQVEMTWYIGGVITRYSVRQPWPGSHIFTRKCCQHIHNIEPASQPCAYELTMITAYAIGLANRDAICIAFYNSYQAITV